MDKTGRMGLLKARFRATGGVSFVATGVRAPKPCPAKRGRVYMPWPDIVVNLKRLPKNMLEPGHKTVPILPTKQRAGESPLTRMSRKLCLKLPTIQP